MPHPLDAASPELLHSLAFVFLACSKLPDGDVDIAEQGAIVSRLLTWLTVGDEEVATEALKKTVASFQTLPSTDEILRQLVGHAEFLGQHLTPEQCQKVITDLIAIVEADGVVLASESDFVLATARSLGVDVKSMSTL